MRVVFWSYGGDTDATSQYRARLVVNALQAQGCTDEFLFDYKGPVIGWNHKWEGAEPPATARVLWLQDPETDLVIISRPARRWWSDVIPFLQDYGVRVIVDMDDLFDKIHHKNIAHWHYDPNREDERAESTNHTWVDEACKRADLVTCTTSALKKRYGYGHGVVLPNLVPERYLRVEGARRLTTLGWTGAVQTHPEDLQVTRGVIQPLLDEHGWSFRIVGDGWHATEALGLREDPAHTGFVPFIGYASLMAEINVGIVPLADTEFNRAKSCLKMIEFAALGVPVAASATPDNQRMYDQGVGCLVKQPHHWRKVLTRLLANEAYREDVAGRSREAMAKHTYERQCDKWAFAWGLERSRVPVGT